jgi:hypothetical protein
MIRLVSAGAGGQPSRWVICFRKTTDSRWISWLACGRYKHVSAFGYIAEVDHWVFLDWRITTLDVIVARGTGADQLMAYYTRDADLLGMAPRKRGRGLRLGLWCVPAVKHLVGIRGSALRPTALWKDCIRQGAEILHECARPASHSTRSDGPAAGEAGSGAGHPSPVAAHAG